MRKSVNNLALRAPFAYAFSHERAGSPDVDQYRVSAGSSAQMAGSAVKVGPWTPSSAIETHKVIQLFEFLEQHQDGTFEEMALDYR